MHELRVMLKSFFSGEILPASHVERWLSGVGALLAISTAFWISTATLGADHALLLIASMGASAVLLFALPHSPLSQPWPVMDGHVIAALISITCYQHIPQTLLAAAVAVAGTVVVMYYLRCLHPPGGATALAAATSDATQQLGYHDESGVTDPDNLPGGRQPRTPQLRHPYARGVRALGQISGHAQ